MNYRTLAFSLLLILPVLTFAQKSNPEFNVPDLPIDATSGLITYQEVVEVEGITATDLFDKALGWANGYYKNPANVIRESSKEKGVLVCKGRYRLSNPADKKGVVTSAGDAMYTLTIQLKDGKFRYTLSELNWMRTSAYPAEQWMDESSQYYKEEFAYYLIQSDMVAKEITDSLKETMTAPVAEKKDDW
jgi:hypothetical protein